MIATISTTNQVVTVINVFTVNPQNQQRLVNLLIHTAERIMKKQAGYVSTNIHKSLDGMRVVNYAQWRSRTDFEAIFRIPEVVEHLAEIMAFAKSDYHLYDVIYSDGASSDPPGIEEPVPGSERNAS